MTPRSMWFSQTGLVKKSRPSSLCHIHFSTKHETSRTLLSITWVRNLTRDPKWWIKIRWDHKVLQPLLRWCVSKYYFGGSSFVSHSNPKKGTCKKHTHTHTHTHKPPISICRPLGCRRKILLRLRVVCASQKITDGPTQGGSCGKQGNGFYPFLRGRGVGEPGSQIIFGTISSL